MNYVARRGPALTEKQREILFDAPLSREANSVVWAGARGRYFSDSVHRLINRKMLAVDLEADRFARKVVLTEQGRQALLQSP